MIRTQMLVFWLLTLTVAPTGSSFDEGSTRLLGELMCTSQETPLHKSTNRTTRLSKRRLLDTVYISSALGEGTATASFDAGINESWWTATATSSISILGATTTTTSTATLRGTGRRCSAAACPMVYAAWRSDAQAGAGR